MKELISLTGPKFVLLYDNEINNLSDIIPSFSGN